VWGRAPARRLSPVKKTSKGAMPRAVVGDFASPGVQAVTQIRAAEDVWRSEQWQTWQAALRTGTPATRMVMTIGQEEEVADEVPRVGRAFLCLLCLPHHP